MRLIEASWYADAGETWVMGSTPVELLRNVAASGSRTLLGEGRMVLEAVDCRPEDVEELAPWLSTLGFREDVHAGGLLLRSSLTGVAEATSHTIAGGGVCLAGARVPFVRLAVVDGVFALAMRELSMLVSETDVWRLWTPLAGRRPELVADPISIGHGGADQFAVWETEDVDDILPSSGLRQSNVHPMDALMDEFEAAAESLMRAGQELDDRISRWHLDFYAGAGNMEVRTTLAAMGQVAVLLTQTSRTLMRRLEAWSDKLENEINRGSATSCRGLAISRRGSCVWPRSCSSSPPCRSRSAPRAESFAGQRSSSPTLR